MKILHVSPTYFDERSVVGGGERYACELARAQSRAADVALVTFGDIARSGVEDGLRVETIRPSAWFRRHPLCGDPLHPRFARLVRWADVVHCHQVRTFSTDAALMLGCLLRKKIFVTDLGGGHPYALSHYLPLLRQADAFLLISEYSRRLWTQANGHERTSRIEVVYGGVDVDRFRPGSGPRNGRVLFVGRLLPHKGVDRLIDAIEPPLALDVVGSAYHPEYFRLLKKKATDRPVTFHHGVSDEALVRMYQEALVTVLPSVYETCYGERTMVPELLGLTVLESMACGTPAVVTDVASLPEIVRNGVTGFVVPPNDPAALRDTLALLARDPSLARALGDRARASVLERFTWTATAERCLAAYAA